MTRVLCERQEGDVQPQKSLKRDNTWNFSVTFYLILRRNLTKLCRRRCPYLPFSLKRKLRLKNMHFIRPWFFPCNDDAISRIFKTTTNFECHVSLYWKIITKMFYFCMQISRRSCYNDYFMITVLRLLMQELLSFW